LGRTEGPARGGEAQGWFYRIILRYGFKQEPNIPEALFRCGERGLSFNMMDTSFFLSREKVVRHQSRLAAMARANLCRFGRFGPECHRVLQDSAEPRGGARNPDRDLEPRTVAK
jgi:hypothetical protein